MIMNSAPKHQLTLAHNYSIKLQVMRLSFEVISFCVRKKDILGIWPLNVDNK